MAWTSLTKDIHKTTETDKREEAEVVTEMMSNSGIFCTLLAMLSFVSEMPLTLPHFLSFITLLPLSLYSFFGSNIFAALLNGGSVE